MQMSGDAHTTACHAVYMTYATAKAKPEGNTEVTAGSMKA